jgi:hypothetical protein
MRRETIYLLEDMRVTWPNSGNLETLNWLGICIRPANCQTEGGFK